MVSYNFSAKPKNWLRKTDGSIRVNRINQLVKKEAISKVQNRKTNS
jgi:hypothetical protein